MNNLGQRGTWRTAYEWAKLVLSLDPEGDPYRICLLLDQLALRGGQAEHLLQLSRGSFYADDLWRGCPNIDISSALAEFKLKQAQKCRASLKKCVEDYPWIFPRLFQELSIDHVPRSVWGKTPLTSRERFECGLYVHNAKDLWNTPEAISLLVEVVESAEVAPAREKARADTVALSHGSITLDEARHVLLSGVPSLVNLVPREYTTMPTSSADPLPPPDNVPSYDPNPPQHHQGPAYQSPFEAAGDLDSPPEGGTPNPRSPEDDQRGLGEAQELQGFQGFLRRFIPWIGTDRPPELTDTNTDAIRARAAELGIPEELLGGEPDASDATTATPAAEAESSNPMGPPVESEPESEHHGQHDGHDAGADSVPNADHPPAEEPYDDARNQRWLAGQGMLRLRDFCAQHGTDESAWNKDNEGADGSSVVGEYARRVMRLEQPRSVRFTLDYALPQGAGQDVKMLVMREIERKEAGS